jgi:hypothetical protein
MGPRRASVVEGTTAALLTAAAGFVLAQALPLAGAHAERPPVPCHTTCTALKALVKGNVSCDVQNYPYDWNNKICEGILPRCVIRPEDAHDVAATVRYVSANKANLSYRSGGHSYTCNGIKSDSIHLDLRSLNAVERKVNADSGKVELVFGPGNTMKRLVDALEGDEMIIHGQCPSVGAGGLFLHGGWHTTLTLKHGTGNATVTHMEVVTASGALLQLSPTSDHQDLWRAMRQAGSSFGIATSITVEPFTLPPTTPYDGGEMFSVDMPRAELLKLTFNASREEGLTTYFHINGIDALAVSAAKEWGENRKWLEGRLGRSLTLREVTRSQLMRVAVPGISRVEGGGGKFGTSGEMPYVVSSNLAYSTVSFTVPLSCYTSSRVQSLLTQLPTHRDNSTDLGCYLQITTTYKDGFVCIDFNCMYDSPFYQKLQRTLNEEIVAACPGQIDRYVNTPSAFLTARDYYPNYNELANAKTFWDPTEVFRVYQGVRPSGIAPDAYEWKREYVRKRSAIDWAQEKAWNLLVRYFFSD